LYKKLYVYYASSEAVFMPFKPQIV